MPQIRVQLSADDETLFDLSEETTTIGRLEDNTIQIEDGSVSSHHAEIVFEGGKYHLHDKDSTNGSFVNGAPTSMGVLKDGDHVRFGSIETVFIGEPIAGGAFQPLPSSERAAATLGSASARPATYMNSSPFPKPKGKVDGLTMAAVILAVLGVIGFLASVSLTLAIQPPA